MKLEIVTPEERAVSEDIDQVSIPTLDGQITVLPHHIPIVTNVIPGELIIKKGDKTSYLVTGDGFAQVTKDRVAVLTDLAKTSEAIDEKAAEEARKRAEEALKQRSALTNEEFALAAAELQKALASLRVKRRHRKI